MRNITFINAGAGSGKTYRLTQELYKAIKEGACEAHQVLLTTFTKKAAAEIKVKAREKLLKEGLFEDVNNLQNAYLGTVHSVGQQIIQKFWHYVGLPKEINIMEDDDKDFYFLQAIANIPSAEQIKRLTELSFKFNFQGDFGLDVNKWKSDLLKIIELARTNAISDFNTSNTRSLNYARNILHTNDKSIDFKSLKKTIRNLIEIGEGLPDKNNGGRKKQAKALRNVDANNIKYSELKKIKELIDDFLKKEFIGNEFEIASSELESFYRSINLLNDIEEYNNLLFDIARHSIQEYSDYKKEVGLIDFSDMENAFLQLLDIEEVKLEIKNTIKLVMVDEFQDSSPIQLAIFIKLSDIVEKSIWVGDPKQSIYAFRGTDPVLIDAVINKIERGKSDGLKTDNLPFSWRSRPEVVDLVNKIFKPALANQVKESTIELNPVRTDNGFKRTALHHFNLIEVNEDGKADTKKYYFSLAKSIVKVLDEKWVVSDKRKSVLNQLNPEKEVVVTKQMKPNDIAILCKTNDAVVAISKELNKLGLKTSAESDDLKETAEYYLMISLVKLVLSQNNTLAKAEIKVLTDSHYGVDTLIDDRLEFITKLPEFPDKDLLDEEDFKVGLAQYYEKLNSWGSDNLLIEGLSEIINEIDHLPIPQLIEHLAIRLNLYSVVAKWKNVKQRRANIQKLIDYANKYDNRCLSMNLGASPKGFVHYLSSIDTLMESKTEDDNAVNVLTFHKAKGLEWPMVILVDLNNDINWGFIARNIFGVFIENKSEIDLDKIIEDRAIISVPWFMGNQNTIVSDDFNNHIISTSEYLYTKLRHDNEIKRILYVGMTRPRDYLVTTSMYGHKKFPWIDTLSPNHKFNVKKDNTIGSYPEDLFSVDKDILIHKLSLSDDLRIENKEKSLYFAGKEIRQKSTFEPYFISPSKIEAKSNVSISLYDDIQNRISTGSSAKDRVDVLGNCLHDILYFYIGSKLNKSTEDTTAVISSLINNHELQGVIDSDEVISSIDKLYDYLKDTFKIIQWHRELALESEINGQIFKGEADLVLETESGYILIDYKSYPGSIERVLDANSSNYAGKYSGQLDAYVQMIEANSDKKVLRKLIYYTVLGQMVEIN